MPLSWLADDNQTYKLRSEYRLQPPLGRAVEMYGWSDYALYELT